MIYEIFLDDERYPVAFQKNPGTNHPVHGCVFPPFIAPHLQTTIVRNYSHFCKVIDCYGLPDYISFDHDLGEEKTGLDCAHYIVNYCLDNNIRPIFRWYVHSQNPVGAANINSLLNSFVESFNDEDNNG